MRDCYPKLGNSDYSIKDERTRMRALVGSICVMAIVHRHHQDRRRRGCVNLRQVRGVCNDLAIDGAAA